MLSPLPSPVKEIDVGFLVFVQRYATDLLKWDILSFFAHNPDLRASASQIARQLGRSTHAVLPEIGDLKILGILEQARTPDHQILYQLTQEPRLRKITLKFADRLQPNVQI